VFAEKGFWPSKEVEADAGSGGQARVEDSREATAPPGPELKETLAIWDAREAMCL
jgi:hypothetical protein